MLFCQWPSCPGNPNKITFSSKEALDNHYRAAHKTHDFSWSRLLDSHLPAVPQLLDDRAIPYCTTLVALSPMKAKSRHPNTKSDGSSSGPRIGDMQSEAPTQTRIAQSTLSATTPGNLLGINNVGERRKSPVSPGSLPQRDKRSGSDPPPPYDTIKPGRSTDRERSPQENKQLRFNLLPDDRRPKPTVPSTPEPEERGPYTYIEPEPLISPSFNDSVKGDMALPQSSLVPSYVLASTNRFTGAEVDALIPRAKSTLRLQPPPLFVYGSLMFPSILNAQASESIKGSYSRLHQRRLYPDSKDWARANVSLKHAAEIMTPAVLPGFDRWEVTGFNGAVIGDANMPHNILSNLFSAFTGKVQGFLIFGLTEEALKAIDELLIIPPFRNRSTERMKKASDRYDSETSDSQSKAVVKPLFTRKGVQVDIELKGGKRRIVDAVTYVWARDSSKEFLGPWDINKFIKKPCFREWSKGDFGDTLWMKEEEELAETMKMVYVLPGDALSHAAFRGDVDELEKLLLDGDDINATCRVYGTVLQTAVVAGKEEMVRWLLWHGADANAKGGQYHNALLAATICGHREIVGALLQSKADVLAEGGRYISALYQAISHSDEKTAYMLLEQGAWLSRDYAELLDLAAERENKRITDLLVEYDVRQLHIGHPGYQESSEIPYPSSRHRSGKEVSLTSGPVLRAVICRALVLKGTTGTWQGRKGVQVIKAALAAGAPETFLDRIGDHLSSVSSLIDYFRGAVSDMLDPRSNRIKSSRSRRRYDEGRIVEELSDSAEDQDVADRSTANTTSRKGNVVPMVCLRT